MSKWNGKVKCIKAMNNMGLELTEGEIYQIKNGVLTYDDGFKGSSYANYEEFIDRNSSHKNHLVEIKEIVENKADWNIEQDKIARYIMVNDFITVALPIDVPIGISFKHPDDEYNEEIGQALALKRLLEYYN